MRPLYLFSLIVIIILGSCNNESTTAKEKKSKRKKVKKKEIINPSKFISDHYNKAKVPFAAFTFTPGNDTTLVYESGTELNIPSDAFVDENGNIVKGDVKVEYREFHSAAQILASGIPMTIGEGIENTFMSAGMCEFKASVNNKPVNINPESPIENKLSSQKTGADYNLYYFNEENGKWEENGKDELTDNVEKKGGPVKPLLKDPNKEIFTITEGEKQELEKYYNWIFQPIDNTDFYEFATYLKDLKIEKKGYRYEITLINHYRKKLVMLCNRVYSPGEGFNNILLQYNKSLGDYFNKHVGEKIIERKFEMNKTGIYNCDSPLLNAQGFDSYVFNAEGVSSLQEIKLMDKSINAVFSFKSTKIKVNPRHENHLLITDQDGQMHLIKSSAIKEWRNDIENECSTTKITLKNAKEFEQLFN